MAFETTIKSDLPRVEKRLLSRVKGAPRKVRKLMVKGGRTFSRQFGKRRLSGQTDTSLGRQTGFLAGSRAVAGLGGDASLRGVGVLFQIKAPYAGAHEAPPLGGAGRTIKPKKGKWLTIPVGKTRTGKGAGAAKVGSIRDDGPLTFVPSKRSPADKYLAFRSPDGRTRWLPAKIYAGGPKRGKKKKPTGDLRWVLVRRVKLKPRLNLLRDWRRAVPAAVKRIAAGIAALIGRGR